MTQMSVALAFLLALCTLIYNVHGGGKGFKAKGSELKKTLVHKIFHHNHHHHYHHHYIHHPHHQYHHHPHHHHHHDGKHKHLNHHRHRHHHYHNPFKHHLHRHHHLHKKTFHRHPHKRPFHQPHHPHKQHQPLHQYHHLHKQHIQKHHKDVEHHHSNKRNGITHAPVPNKLQLHVRINSSQATKRQSLPDLLANLGQHLVKLGSSLSPKTSHMAVRGNTDNEGDVRNEVPEPKSPTVQSPAVQDSPVTVPTVSRKKNVSVNEVEGLLHRALDAENSDEMESAFSENGAAEASDAVTAAAGNKTSADRRNETFPEAEIYGRPLDDREYDASERQREAAYGTLKEIAGQSFETENTHQLDQIRNGQSNPGKENKPAVHDHDHSKNVEPMTNVDDVDTNTALEHEKRKENSTQNDSLKLKTQSSSKEPKSSDMNSTLEDEGREIDKDTSKSGPDESQKSVTGQSDAQNITDDEREKTEVSGSGEDSFDDGNTEKQTATDNKGSYESKSAQQAPSKPSQDEEVNVAEESIDQNTIGSAEGQQVRERKSKPFINQTEDSLDEPTKPVSEGNIDQQAVVNVAENQVMGNQSDDSFQPDSTEGADLKMEGSNLENNKLINPPDSNDPEKTVSLDSRIKGSSIQDAKLRGDLDTQAIQHSFSGPENSMPTTSSEKVLQTKNGGPSTQLDAIAGNSNQSNEKDHPALNDMDKASGASNVGQESPQENEETQEQDSHTDIIGFAEGPKPAPAVLDEPAEPSSPSDADPQVVNVESPQEGNLQEDTSQEAYPGDVADAIPVYTLSSPVGDDTFRGDESSLSTPTSSVTTSSSNFIDTGGNMSTGYSESPSSSEGYGTFTSPVSQSQEDFGSLSQGAVVQRDMLDDPVQESLETNVDSKSS